MKYHANLIIPIIRLLLFSITICPVATAFPQAIGDGMKIIHLKPPKPIPRKKKENADTPSDKMILPIDTFAAITAPTHAPGIFPELRQRQKILDSQKIIYLKNPDYEIPNDSIKALMDVFYAEQYRSFLDPQAPYFMMMSKDAKWAFGVGGKIGLNVWYGWNGDVNDNGFSPYLVPIPKDPLAMKHLYGTPANTALFLTLLGHGTPLGDVMAYIEAGFKGKGSMDLELKKAYFNVRGFTIGYATSTFVDENTSPPVINGANRSGVLDRSTLLVRYNHLFRNHWRLTGGVEFPRTAVSPSDSLAKPVKEYLPDLCTHLQYEWDNGLSHVRLAGLMRPISYRNLTSSTNHTVLGWGLALTSAVKVIPSLTFYGGCIIGQGHGSYLADLSKGSYDLLPERNDPGKLFAPKAFSWIAGTKWNIKDNLYLTGTYSQLNNYEYSSSLPDDYKYGMGGSINAFWDIMPRLTTGLTYMAAHRKNYSGESGTSHRVEALVQLSF